MKQLQERVYTKAEIADFLSINVKDKNFKRNVENTLKKWGYDFEYPPYSKTITITYVPEGENKLAEILIREYNLDVQIDTESFACFLHAFNYIEGFYSMPWGERQTLIKDVYGIDVNEKTLRNWANKLMAAGALVKTNIDKTYWKSTRISESEMYREETTKEEFVAFYKYRNEEYKKNIVALITTGNEDLQEVKKKAYGEAHKAAMRKFDNWCFYSCKSFLLSSFDDKCLTEIFEIVEEIAPCIAEWKAQEDYEKAQAVKAEIDRIISSGEFYF